MNQDTEELPEGLPPGYAIEVVPDGLLRGRVRLVPGDSGVFSRDTAEIREALRREAWLAYRGLGSQATARASRATTWSNEWPTEPGYYWTWDGREMSPGRVAVVEAWGCVPGVYYSVGNAAAYPSGWPDLKWGPKIAEPEPPITTPERTDP
jgi:hypothetical protein